MNKLKYVIVVGLDYSTASERALDEALALARTKHGVQLHVINVRPPPSVEGGSIGELPPEPPWRYWASELQDHVERRVAAFQASAGAPPVQHLFTHQRMNDPAHEIVQLAVDVEADLIVVGAHDWLGSSQLRPESVAEAVTRLAPCPVLSVRREVVSEHTSSVALDVQ